MSGNTTISGNMQQTDPLLAAQQAAGMQGTGGTGKTGQTGPVQGGTLPETTAKTVNDLLKEAGLPTLSGPTGSLSLDTLMSAIGDEVRRQACKDGVASLEGKAADQKEVNDKELQEIADRLEDMKKKSVLNGFMKAFQIIGIIVGAIASVASIVAGALTANPLLIAAGVVGMAMTVDSVLSIASDGKYSIMAGMNALGKAMGMSDQAAQWFAFSMQMVMMLGSVAMSFGAGLANTAGVASKITEQAVSTAVKVTTMASKVANVASGVNSMATGAGTIAGAAIDYNVGKSQANSKELEAILERIRESMDIDRKLVESELERANALMTKVNEIVQDCVSTQQAILTTAPTMA